MSKSKILDLLHSCTRTSIDLEYKASVGLATYQYSNPYNRIITGLDGFVGYGIYVANDPSDGVIDTKLIKFAIGKNRKTSTESVVGHDMGQVFTTDMIVKVVLDCSVVEVNYGETINVMAKAVIDGLIQKENERLTSQSISINQPLQSGDPSIYVKETPVDVFQTQGTGTGSKPITSGIITARNETITGGEAK